MPLKIGIPKEIYAGEKRVAATPETTEWLHKLGFTVALEAGAGDNAHFSDEAYKENGVEIVEDTKKLWAESDIILKVRAPHAHPTLGVHECELLREGTCLISFIWPAQNPDLMDRLAARKVTVIAMDSVPRISRAQKLDALSSMANIGGYRAVIEAANHFGRFFTGQITAAGKVPPAKVMVIGAGVAGLAALGAANGLGAIVRAFDTRPEVKEQVESMGAEFLELDFEEEGGGAGGYAKVMSPEFIKAEMALFARQAMEVDIIITTALIPGKPAPELITAGMVESMRDGSVVVDMAAEQGGNCALTEPGKVVVKHGVTLIGYTDLPSRLPTQSSQLYGTNLRHFLTDLCKEKDGQINVDMEDDVIRGATVIKDGEITWPPPKPKVQAIATPPKKEPAAPPQAEPEEKKSSGFGSALFMLIGAGLLAGLGYVSPPDFLAHFTVFVLACFVGYQIVWNVTPALHTPLMSVTNAISGIIVIGALLQVSGEMTSIVTILAAVAILVATINISGGFIVTQRMLRMFQR
ncbi:NAD(P) transhydrogenase subunit alpha [Candidatus Thiomargarita nelsonii]|uniref:NAD(P) transhydrogenase subunit alpha n=1 Tax=Candidatus Thiomargarita nelsonii TaxID=1003181 RepID=A0A0A6P7V7_9GAMM|nr:NAD(P) transhydrogenase subunit alpha [Candidatus Thiomargarita nelsonii]